MGDERTRDGSRQSVNDKAVLRHLDTAFRLYGVHLCWLVPATLLIRRRIKQWVKPTTATLVVASLTDMTRSKIDFIAENAMLRQQLIVLNRQVNTPEGTGRPQLNNGDRLRLVLLARCTQFWRQALHIVQPDTLLRWHRELFQYVARSSSNPSSAIFANSGEIITPCGVRFPSGRLQIARTIACN
jgi:hypothetical protein